MTDLDPDELEFIERVRWIASGLTREDHHLEEPPAGLWERIESAAADSEPAQAPESGPHSVRPMEADPTDNVVPLWRRAAPVLAVAAAVMAIVAIGTTLVDRGSGSELIAEAAIVNDGLPVANPDTGTAELREVDGRLVLDVDVPDLPASDGFYEIWIIDTDVSGMYSLGVVTGDGQYPLPDHVDPAEYPVVDVSVEPPDGDPTHSGQSIWRGVLEL